MTHIPPPPPAGGQRPQGQRPHCRRPQGQRPHCRRPICERHRCPRRGFTLVEVVVATLLLSLAALGVASTGTYVAHLAATARAVALATRATALVVDSLRATPCASLGSGSQATAAGTVHWRTTPAAGTRWLVATLAPTSPRVTVPPVEEALLPCD